MQFPSHLTTSASLLLHQRPKVLHHSDIPQSGDQHWDAGVVVLLSELFYHPVLTVLNGVEVGWVPGPLNEADMRPLHEPLGDNLGLVARGWVLQEVVTAVLLQLVLQLVLQQLQVLHPCHFPFAHEINPPGLPSSTSWRTPTPSPWAGTSLSCWWRRGRSGPPAVQTLALKPEFKVTLICIHHTLPVPVLLSKGQPLRLTPLVEKRLLGHPPGGELEGLAAVMLDGVDGHPLPAPGSLSSNCLPVMVGTFSRRFFISVAGKTFLLCFFLPFRNHTWHVGGGLVVDGNYTMEGTCRHL